MNKKIEYTLLALIMLLAISTRFYNLGSPSLFNDELTTVHIAKSETIGQMMTDYVIPDVHPPGFQFMMYYVVHYIGDTEYWLRFPTAIAGILSIFMLYILGKYLYDIKTGIIAAALTCLMWAPLYYSQEARAYSFLFLFSIVSVYYWLKIINAYRNDNTANLNWIVIFILSGILSEYFQYLGLLLHILLGLASILIFRKQPKKLIRILFIFSIIGIAFLPWLSYALNQVAIGAEWIKKPKLLAFGYYLAFLFNISPYVLGIALVLYLILLKKLISERFPKENFFLNREIFLILWLIVPFTIIFIKSLISQPVLTYYSLIISAPPAYILFARSITKLKIREKIKNGLTIAILFFIAWQLIFSMDYYSQPYRDHVIVFGKKFKKRTKQMFREAAQYVKNNDSKYPNSIIAAYAWHPYYFDYYFEKIDFKRKVDIHVLDLKDSTKFKDLSNYGNKEYIWLVRGHKETDSLLIDWMDNHFNLVHLEPMSGADVWLYKIKKEE